MLNLERKPKIKMQNENTEQSPLQTDSYSHLISFHISSKSLMFIQLDVLSKMASL